MQKKSITTKVGDEGETFLYSGEKVMKNSPRPMAYGDMDELVSVLGIARCMCKREGVSEEIMYVQKELFKAASEIATTEGKLNDLKDRIDEKMLSLIEEKKNRLEEKTDIPQGFIIPCGSIASSHIDHARTICRRCERRVVDLFDKGIIKNKIMIIWFNRLSDYLYLLARYEEGDKTVLKN